MYEQLQIMSQKYALFKCIQDNELWVKNKMSSLFINSTYMLTFVHVYLEMCLKDATISTPSIVHCKY